LRVADTGAQAGRPVSKMPLPSTGDSCASPLPSAFTRNVPPNAPKAIFVPSGEKAGRPSSPIVGHRPPEPRGVTSRRVGVTSRIPPQAESTAITLPAGDHEGALASVATSLRPEPSSPTTKTDERTAVAGFEVSGCTRWNGTRAVAKAIRLPSGDHVGQKALRAPVGARVRCEPSGSITKIELGAPTEPGLVSQSYARRLPSGDQATSAGRMQGSPVG